MQTFRSTAASVIFDQVQRGLSICSFRFAPRADIPASASVYEYAP
jgi:hypothetical protein